MYYVKPIGSEEFAAVEALASAHPCPPYFEHRFEKDRLGKISRMLIEKELRSEGSRLFGLFDPEGAMKGIAGARLLEFDTHHFGMAMGRVFPFLVELGVADVEARMLLDAALAALKDQGCKHAYVRINSAEMPSVRAAESLGFVLADTIVEYVFCFAKTEIPRSSSSSMGSFRKKNRHLIVLPFVSCSTPQPFSTVKPSGLSLPS